MDFSQLVTLQELADEEKGMAGVLLLVGGNAARAGAAEEVFEAVAEWLLRHQRDLEAVSAAAWEIHRQRTA